MKSIREVARLSGVSTATVSRYVNKNGYILEETGKKIQKVIDKYGYTPNNLTTAIINGRSKEIGLVVQNINNPFFAQLMEEIEIHTQKQGYNLIICNARGEYESEKKYYTDLISNRVSGILVINTNNQEIYKKCPVAIVGIEKRILNYPKIKVDNKKGINQIFNNIKDIDSKRILYLTSKEINHAAFERYSEFKKLVQSKKIKFDTMYECDNYKNLHKFEVELRNYDLVICWNDICAHSIYSKAKKQNLKIPQDLEITGFDHLDLNLVFSYNLTTVKQNISNIGKESFNLLLKQINDEKVHDVILDVDFIKGDTIKVNKK